MADYLPSHSTFVHRRRRSSLVGPHMATVHPPAPAPDPDSDPHSHSVYAPIGPSSDAGDPDGPLFDPDSKPAMPFLRRHLSSRRSLLAVCALAALLLLLYRSQHPSSPLPLRHAPSSALQSDSTLPACSAPPGEHAQKYALMIDAGSTGSRIHVYRFSRCQDQDGTPSLPKLIDEKFVKIQPGLSAYPNSPTAAAQSLKVLMQAAMDGVPADQRACTPIEVRATAGLRLLGEKQSGAILEEVERWLRSDWPFSLAKGAVSIMDGAVEGVFAWVTINYVRCTQDHYFFSLPRFLE